MVIWSTLEASCPMCEYRTRLREVGSGFTMGQDSDLLVRMRGKHIIQAEIHTCHRCHYSGYAKDFLRDVTPAQKSRFLELVSPALLEASLLGAAPGMPVEGRAGGKSGFEKTPLPDVQYYWSFKSAEALGLPPMLQGERLLRAYWCLRLPPSSHLPPRVHQALGRVYLKGAIGKLRQGLRFETNPNWVYLVAELCRRNKNFLLASRYFRRFLEQPGGAGYLKLAARKLLLLADARKSKDLSMEEILYDKAPDAPSGHRGDADQEGTSRDAG
jgi:hypothetical protein